MDPLAIGAGVAAAVAAGVAGYVALTPAPAAAAPAPASGLDARGYAVAVPNEQPYNAYGTIPASVAQVPSLMGGRTPGAPDRVGQALGYAGQAVGVAQGVGQLATAYGGQVAGFVGGIFGGGDDVSELVYDDTTSLAGDYGAW